MSGSVVILAAGLGSRMNSDLPKVLHPLGGAPILWHVLAAAEALAPDRIILVTGHGAAAVEAAARARTPGVETVRQAPLRGTGHAALEALPLLGEAEGPVTILFGDTPLIRPGTLAAMQGRLGAGADLVLLGFRAAEPAAPYGRLVTEGEEVLRVVEWKEASPEERALPLCNSGVLCTGAGTLRRLLPRIAPAPGSGELYLTALPGLLRAAGGRAVYVPCAETETLGVNSRADLARAEAAFQARRRAELLDAGVTMTAPETVFLAFDTEIGPDTVLGPHVVFGPGVTVENGAEIRAFCHIEGAHVSAGARIGPFARLRPGAEIGEDAHAGSFVEIKEAAIGRGARVNHLAYVGDAEIGAGANIGAGAITCNYDGAAKHRTVIGPRAFVGSNAALVAPVRIGAEAYVGSGSVITADVPDGALAIARARQETKPGLALRLLERLRAAAGRRQRESA